MISKKELGYVTNPARYAPFPGKDYAIKTMDSLINSYNLFLSDYQNKTHDLIFSNGDEIEFGILDKNIAHLLGIDCANLKSAPMEDTVKKVLGLSQQDYIGTHNILKTIINRAEEVVNNDSNPYNYKILNYYKVLIKSIIFSKISNFENFDFGCINYKNPLDSQEKSISYMDGCEKVLFTESNEAITPYFMMGLVYDETEDMYVPKTSVAPQEFTNLFQNQELIIPTQVLTNDDENFIKKVATNKEKLAIFNMYKRIIGLYRTDSYINIFNDYENMLLTEESKKLVR